MSIAIGCDPNAARLKEIIRQHLEDQGYQVVDYGGEDPIYANVAIKVAEAVAGGQHERGILLCGTGIGMCIAANKVAGAYAASCSDSYSTMRSILSNNANIMTMGSEILGPELAKQLVSMWMSVKYEPGGRSQPKIERIYQYSGDDRHGGALQI